MLVYIPSGSGSGAADIILVSITQTIIKNAQSNVTIKLHLMIDSRLQCVSVLRLSIRASAALSIYNSL